MSPELGVFAIIHLITLILLTFQCRNLLKMQEKHGGGRFQFTLADCWAASLVLIPGVGILTWFINDLDLIKGGFSEKAAYVCAWSILIIGSQLGGIMLMIATNISPARSTRNDKSSFGAILVGGLAGLFLPFVGLFFIIFNRQKKPKQEKLLPYDEYVRTRKSKLIYTTIVMGILLLVLFGPDSLFWLILPIGYYFQTTNNKTKQRYMDAAERRKKPPAPIEEKQSSA